MGDVIDFPDKGVTPATGLDVTQQRLLGEWLYSVGFLHDWVPDMRPPDFALDAYITVLMVKDELSAAEALNFVREETGWAVQ